MLWRWPTRCLLLIVFPLQQGAVIALTVDRNNKMVLAKNVQVDVKPDRVDEFLALIQNVRDRTMATESGALQYVIGRDVNNPNVIHLHEQYKTLDDSAHHENTEHYQELMAFAATDPLSTPLVLEKYSCAHAPVVIPSRPAFCLNVESCIKPEFRDEFLTLMKSHQAKSQAEPACLQFDWGESIDTPNSFYIHEQYKDKSGFDAHESSPHFAKFGEFNAKDPYSKPQVVSFYNTIV